MGKSLEGRVQNPQLHCNLYIFLS